MPSFLLPKVMSSFELTTSAGVPSELVDQARGDARAVGYAQGWSQGLHEAAEARAAELAAARAEQDRLAAAHADRLASALRAVQAAGARLDATTVTVTDQIADDVLALAVELAGVLLGRELRDPITAATTALARVLHLAPENEAVTICLSSADHRTLTGPGGPELVASLEPGAGRISFEADASLNPGDATARVGSTSIDARLTVAIDRMRSYVAE